MPSIGPSIDCHCHILDPVGFAYDPASPFHPAGHEIATAHQLEQVFAAHGVERALLVQPNSGYAEDNRCLLDAIARSKGRWKGVAVVPLDTSIETLAGLKARGIVGAAFNLPFFERGHYAECRELIAKLTELDLFLQVQVSGDLIFDILPILQASNARLLFDHCGRPLPELGVEQAGFRALRDLGEAGRAVVKLSGFMKYSNLSHPFADTVPFMQALLSSFGAEGCVWGSDWPFLRARERVDYGPLQSLFEDMVPDAGTRQKILWDTPFRLFGF